MVPLIQVTDLCKTYQVGEIAIQALCGVTVNVDAGEFVSIMGSSGSGKSTFMNILGCLDIPDQGSYYLDGISIEALGRDDLAQIRNQKIGFVFQGFNLLSRTSALENVELPLIYSAVPSRDRRRKAMEALQAVGLSGREDHHPNQLSGGQQQRVAIARALVNQPAIILADEPTGNLDTKTSLEIMQLLTRLNEDQKMTVVIVTHEPDIATFTHRTIFFRDGHVLEDRAIPRGRENIMRILSSLKVALRALRTNKMRSFLTMLGIIIGVGAVIVMVAIGTGATEMISKQIASMGSNLIMVLPGTTTSGGARMGMGTVSTLTSDDARAIKEECPAVKEVAPIWGGVTQVVYGNQNWNTGVNGTTPAFFAVREWPMAAGRLFTDQEVSGAVKVAVVGQSVVENLFGNENPLGQIVRIKKVPFTVIGVLDRKGQSARGDDQDDVVYIPLTTSQKKVFGSTLPRTVRIILVQAQDLTRMAEAEKQVNDLLKQRHRTQPGQLTDFTVRNLTEIMATAEQSAKVMSLLLGSIALVSLLVGGIGIMNIMLVSVTERTREIGIRMAVGARSRDILFQFLTESIVLSLVGGLIGIGLGIIGSRVMAYFTEWNIVISYSALLMSFSFSAAVGIFFGFYPARKAARLNPIEALHYE